MPQERSRDDYKVAWICPLEVEQIAALEMLDEEHPALPKSSADHNVYSLGSINGHNVVIAGLHQPGNCPAATVVAQMRMTFPNLRFGLLVGIGGGVPAETDNGMIRLGHVVVSKPTGGHSGALQYDHGKAKEGHFERTGALAPPPAVLLNAAQALAVQRARLDVDPVLHDVRRIDITRRGLRRFQYPGEQNDHLASDYTHRHRGALCATDCVPSKRIPRTGDDNDTFVVVHRGNIASGELVVKDASLRDTLAQPDGLLCFETEAAGAMCDFPCLVVRGISDYCDPHKNDVWHGYAAAVAAAYARQVFFHLPVDEVQRCSGNAEQTLPSSFILPFKLPGVNSVSHFVARHEELRRLHKELKCTGDRRMVILHGLGGMGKTQTTIAFAKKHRDEYSAVLWFDARDTTTLQQSYKRLAKRIVTETSSVSVPYISNVLSGQDLDEIVNAVKRWLDEPNNNRWLIIYDNYDDVKLHSRGNARENDESETGSRAYDIRPFFPDTEHGAILITTRMSSVKLAQRVQLGKLAELEDGLAILASTSGRTDLSKDPDALLLAKKLDGLPLALATAGAYLDQVASSCTEYLEVYEKAWLRLQKESPELIEYDRALYSTWNISLLHIQLQNQHAADLLRLWAYFDNHDLWYELLRAEYSESPLWLDKMTKDKLTFETVMRVLCEYGLAEPNAGSQELGSESAGYSMHECVHAWATHVLNTEISQTLAWIAIQRVASHVPNQERSKYWVVQRRLLRHADRCAEIFGAGADAEESAQISSKLGHLYSTQGRFKEAEVMCKRALRSYEKALGPDHISTLDEISHLGALYFNRGHLIEAKAIYERALEGYEKALGPDHISTLGTVNNLGTIFAHQDQPEDAEAMYERARKGYEKALGPDHTLTLGTVNDLGLLYADQGRPKDAEAMCEQAFQGFKEILGPDHISTLSKVHNLGTLYADQGRPKEAEAMYKQALQGYEKALGPDHTSTIAAVYNLGHLYSTQGRFKEAEAMYEQALQGFEKALWLDHTVTLKTVNHLGTLYLKQGRPKEAEAMYKRALQGYEKALGPDHKSTLNTINSLGILYSVQSQPKDAEVMYKRALRGYKKVLGSDHSFTLGTINNLGTLYSNESRPKEAEAMYKRALRGYEKALGLNHALTLAPVWNLRILYSNLGRPKEAEAMHKRALQSYEKSCTQIR